MKHTSTTNNNTPLMMMMNLIESNIEEEVDSRAVSISSSAAAE